MPADVPFHLRRGDTGPGQQSSVTCGSASLTVARMLVSPEFTQWIVNGTRPEGGSPDTRSESERFAEHEREVMNRTNGIHAAGGKLNFPWPQALGTPPWGAEKELEFGAAQPGASYAMRLLRTGSSDALREAHHDLAGRVREGMPALLYIGNAWAPRHVTLLLPGNGPTGPTGSASPTGSAGSAGSAGTGSPDGDAELDVYDPATGLVSALDPDRFANSTLDIAGWNTPLDRRPAKELATNPLPAVKPPFVCLNRPHTVVSRQQGGRIFTPWVPAVLGVRR